MAKGTVLVAMVIALLAVPAALGADSVYWSNYSGNKLSFVALDASTGGDLTTNGATVNGPAGVALDPAAGRIYWANSDGNKISFANLNGGGGGDLTTTGATVNTPWGVALDPAAGRIYWASNGNNKISFANLNGSGGGDLTTTGATVSHPFGVALDAAAGRIYWANQVNKISFANLNGSGGGDLTTTGATVNIPRGVALDPAAGRIYWANAGGNKISFANLNGSGGGDLPTLAATVFSPNFPVLLRAPSGTGAPAISGGSTVGSTLSCSQGSWASDLLPAFLYRAPQSFAYQWARNGTDIAGASSSTLTASSPGSYSCRVTATNYAGSGQQTSAAHSVLATLSVGKTGSGAGTVASSPAGIDCGATCSGQFSDGTSVTLSAAAAAGSSFAGWSGECSGTGSCTVTMSADKTVTATFESDKTLTISKAGSGSGSITSGPAGIACGSTCSHAFTHGTPVTLTAAPSSRSKFSGWSGDCSGTGACTLTMSAHHSATATFTALCVVPKLKGKTLAAAKRALKKAHCSLGSIKKAYSAAVKKGRVISQKPKPGLKRPPGSKVSLKVSKGKKP